MSHASQISETDVDIFKAFMNPNRFDLDSSQLDTILAQIRSGTPAATAAASRPPQGANIEVISEGDEPMSDIDEESVGAPSMSNVSVGDDDSGSDEARTEPDTPSPPPAPSRRREKGNNVFRERMQQYYNSRSQPQEPHAASDTFSNLSEPALRRRQTERAATPKPQASSYQEPEGHHEQPSHRVDMRQIFADTQYIPEELAEIDVGAENRDPQLRREKQEILFQLLREYPTESKGQWNMNVPLFELKYELKRREEFAEEMDQLKFMRDFTKMIIVGVEMLNQKFGPFLSLKGWSKDATKDMSRYDRPLKALYRRYFRKKRMNPVMELLWLVVGSMVVWHIKTKYLGFQPDNDGQARSQAFDSAHDIRPPPGSGAPFGGGGGGAGGGLNLGSLLRLFSK